MSQCLQSQLKPVPCPIGTGKGKPLSVNVSNWSSPGPGRIPSLPMMCLSPRSFCHILCAQNKLSPTPGSRPASSSKEAHLNQIIYSPNQKGNNVYNLQSSQVLAPAEAEELETNRSRVLCGGLCWPSGPLFREMNHESYVHMVQKPPS